MRIPICPKPPGIALHFSAISESRGLWMTALFLLLVATRLSLGSTPFLTTSDLSPYHDIHRLVIVFPGKGSEEFLDQWDSAHVHVRMEHRSLLIFQVKDPKAIFGLRKMLSPTESGFHIWLIGMDGHLLFTTAGEIEPDEIFARIDDLPRRREEIRRYNNWVGGVQTDP
jgi:hypothetical protein